MHSPTCFAADWKPRRALSLLLLFVAFASASAGTRTAEMRLFVAPDGDDAQDGTMARPLATLVRARDALRTLRQGGEISGAVTVYLRAGTYRFEHTFELTRDDGGSDTNPVIYRPWERERVILSGARAVRNFVRVENPRVLDRLAEEARPHVLQSDLRAQGIEDLGEAVSVGRRLELFFDKKPLELARWPNEGFVTIQRVTGGEPFTSHGIRGDKIGQFTYDGDRPERWRVEPEVWLHGYWFWDWSDAWQRIENIDADTKMIRLYPPFHGYGYRPGQRFYAANLLCELDRAGEYYVDREDGVLYVWPPRALPGAETEDAAAEVSVLGTLLSIDGASDVTIQGLVFEATRDTAIEIRRSERVRIAGCVIRNTGSWATRIDEGSECGVIGCDILATGEGGVALNGGDRNTLTPSEHYATDNRIHHFGRLQRTYRPAVAVSGVGQHVEHNVIHDGPHNAIQLSGNDHSIEYNEVFRVCYETGDVGAFYTGRDWTARGTRVRYNFFHDIAGPGLYGAMAVYLDDSASGFEIRGNLFVRAGRAAFIGGGRDNIVENNVFIECQPSVHVDARGLGWMRDHVEPGGTLPARLAAVPYRDPPWSERYPQLLELLDDDPGAPKGNVIRRNISVGGTWSEIEPKARSLVKLADNFTDGDPQFVDAASGDYNLKDNSPAWALGFERIPFARIGLENTEWRAEIPALR